MDRSGMVLVILWCQHNGWDLHDEETMTMAENILHKLGAQIPRNTISGVFAQIEEAHEAVLRRDFY